MKELIPIDHSEINHQSVQTVNARELHSFLESKQDFSTWLKAKVLDNPFFMENQDYVLLHNSVEQTGRGGHNRKDYALTIDTSKKVAMSEQTDIGNRVREYFIECEYKARTDPMVALNDPATMRGLLLSYSEKIIAAEGLIAEQKPKVDAFARISEADGALCLTDASKLLQVRRKDLIQHLSSNVWIYKRVGHSGWLGYEVRRKQGLLTHKTRTIEYGDGREKVVEQVLVTPKGLTKLATVFEEATA